jgi:putative methionine-R-sulfoxide reductase with GAF domain
MSVHPRQVTPTLLHVASILSRLRGDDAAAEVCRFLRAEFPDYRWAGVYRIEGTNFRMAGWDGPGAAPALEGPLAGTSLDRAREGGKTVVVGALAAEPLEPVRAEGATSRAVVPIRFGANVIAVLIVESSAVTPLDASDGRFLEQVAAKLGPVLAPP